MTETEFTREDVIRHLAELGYDNVDEAKLDSFCADLKRLIKYEEKKRRVNEKLKVLEKNQGRMRVEESREVSHESTTSPEAVRRKRRIRREDKRKAKEEKLKEKCRSMEETTSSYLGDKEEYRGYTSEVGESSARDEVDLMARRKETSELSEFNHEPSSLYIDVDLPPSRPSSAPAHPLAASLLSQPGGRAGFIRVRSGPSVGKKGPDSDPVTLHQKYREQWARVPIPGERRHDKLRWAVRGWMMGEEPL